MLNNNRLPDPVTLFRAATDRAIVVVEAVRPDQLGSPTPCCEWTVRRAAGIVGPAVDVGDDASPQDRLMAAMGRQP